LRGRRGRILIASTRFGAGTCSCAPAGSGAISFTKPDTGSHTSAIAQPDACAYTYAYTESGTSAYGQRGISREFCCRGDER
jgi:hypothetical protein